MARSPSSPATLVQTEPVTVEVLPDALALQWADVTFRQLTRRELENGTALAQIESALELLGVIPTVFETVCALVRCLHPLVATDDSVDISFSDPALPFSSFISIPTSTVSTAAVRIAEALLHEAMHLQLSLIESHVPLAIPGSFTYFSPWRNEYRTPQGVVHALYVFRTIAEFFAAFAESAPDAVNAEHARRRRTAILRQIADVADFALCPDLTANGAGFVQRLLA
jgi:HEXXH motif-containing protein